MFPSPQHSHSFPSPLQPMTVHEYEVAQSLTAKPVKGMLTGGHAAYRELAYLACN